jgi:hypothetical protein
MLADSPIDPKKPNKLIHKFIINLCTNLFDTLKIYTQLSHILTKSEIRDNSSISRSFLKDMKDTPIFREYLHYFKTGDTQCLQYILSFLNFGKKIYYEDDDLQASAFRTWLDVEDRLSALELPAFVDNLSVIMEYIFSEWSTDYFLPKHGSGAVSEQGIWGVTLKNQFISYDNRVNMLYLKGNNTFNDVDDFSTDLTPVRSNSVRSLCHSTKPARLMFVPKDWKKKRSICMEPISLQWAQQGVRLWYETYLLKKSCLKRHIFLRDQTMNQKGAYYGSLTNNMDTIDLSSASDSVAWDLIRCIMPTKVLKHLQATRSYNVVLPDDAIISVKKFAPMGSALCFPVQSTLYAAIAMMVGLAKYIGRDWHHAGIFNDIDVNYIYKMCFASNHFTIPRRGAYHPFLVYGDDIICDKQMTSNIIEALISLGFDVNVEKTYTSHDCYRESCGKHFMRGNDVTPLLFRTKKISKRISIDSLASVIELANNAGKYDYVFLRKHIIQFLLYYPIEGKIAKNMRIDNRNPILFSSNSDDSMSILSSNPRNTHLVMRCYESKSSSSGSHIDYQRDEYLSITVGPRYKRKLTSIDDQYMYTVWWRSRYDVDEPLSIDSDPVAADARGARIKWRWSATW